MPTASGHYVTPPTTTPREWGEGLPRIVSTLLRGSPRQTFSELVCADSVGDRYDTVLVCEYDRLGPASHPEFAQ